MIELGKAKSLHGSCIYLIDPPMPDTNCRLSSVGRACVSRARIRGFDAHRRPFCVGHGSDQNAQTSSGAPQNGAGSRPALDLDEIGCRPDAACVDVDAYTERGREGRGERCTYIERDVQRDVYTERCTYIE